MKNVVFWDIKTQVVLHRRHITSPIQSSAVRSDVGPSPLGPFNQTGMMMMNLPQGRCVHQRSHMS
jgi:hypothetical protein